MNYEQAVKKLESARDQSAGKLIANNTRLFRRAPDRIAVQLHATDVVTYCADGSVILNTGGWRTSTTKARISEYAPGRGIYQQKGIWYLYGAHPFADGMIIRADGKVKGEAPTRDVKADTKLRADINRFVAEYVRLLYTGKIPAPGHSDCWACYMKGTGTHGKDVANPLGTDHVREHIREKYYVPSLILKALDAVPSSAMEKHNASYYLKLDGWESHAPYPSADTPLAENFMAKSTRGKLRRYCLRCCGLSC